MIEENLVHLNNRVRDIALRAGRDPEEIRIVAVTKTIGPEKILEAYRAGQRCFGENRVQELTDKADRIPPDAEWHLIGHLQTNKVKAVVGKAALIHSVDSVRLAAEIEKRAAAMGRNVDVLAEIKTTDEETKQGMLPSEFGGFLKAVAEFSRVRVLGLMTVGPLTGDREKIRSSFRGLRLLADEFRGKGFPELKYLSMGMSDDYPIAIEEGAHFIRVGRAIFGERMRN